MPPPPLFLSAIQINHFRTPPSVIDISPQISSSPNLNLVHSPPYHPGTRQVPSDLLSLSPPPSMSLLTALPHLIPHRSAHLDGTLTTASQNLNARDPSARLTRLACSSVDLLWVMSYTPGEGNEATLISVNFTCKADVAVGIHIRLVVGCRAVSTQVHEIDAPGCGRWQLKGHAPSFSKQKSSSPMVPLTIQAVDSENHVVDSVTFGDFLYNGVGGCPACYLSSIRLSHVTERRWRSLRPASLAQLCPNSR